MSAGRTWCCAGVLACVAGLAFAQEGREFKLLETSIYVEPVSVARVAFRDGRAEMVSEWMSYGAGRAACNEKRVFSAFGDADSDGFMDDTGGCGLGSSRWYFGTAYCNNFVTDDFNVDECADLAVDMCRADFGWYWTCGGFGSERCIVAIWTEDSNANDCELDSWDYAGWLLDFGSLTCNPGGYYYSNVDISATGVWTMPTEGSGSYPIMYAQDVTTGGALILATCAQPMLWGPPNASGGEPDGPGSSGPNALVDSEEPFGEHTADECVDMRLAVCPDPLQAMLQFWGRIDPDCAAGCDFGDCNGDGVVNSQDVLCFLNLWAAQDPRADCDRNGIVNTQDVLCFLNIWAACRG